MEIVRKNDILSDPYWQFQAFESIKNDTTFAVEGCHYVLLREYRRSELFRYLTENFVADEPLCNCLSSTWSDAWEYVFESQVIRVSWLFP